MGMTVVTDADGNSAATLSKERTTAKRTDTFGAAISTPISIVRCASLPPVPTARPFPVGIVSCLLILSSSLLLLYYCVCHPNNLSG